VITQRRHPRSAHQIAKVDHSPRFGRNDAPTPLAILVDLALQHRSRSRLTFLPLMRSLARPTHRFAVLYEVCLLASDMD
jgi:hypothetical protein